MLLHAALHRGLWAVSALTTYAPGAGQLVLFDANKATGRRQHNWVLDKTFDERDGAMDYAKEGGFAQYKGSGDYAATTLRCTKHEGCWEGWARI